MTYIVGDRHWACTRKLPNHEVCLCHTGVVNYIKDCLKYSRFIGALQAFTKSTQFISTLGRLTIGFFATVRGANQMIDQNIPRYILSCVF